ncbi:filament-like protein (DUF869) [Rhynchospora pubera]|uniref:Filament-like protein (DUF869) n=1 Tax=Rhynchospora pubera TaxID=906938 RepID=A0AAV8F6K3_9POAL|nr:filament-like protein (DUF869) [Rhynchospora pubera]
MDRRSWPWKKKSSEKTANADASPSSGATQAEPENPTINYIQVSPETYARLNDLEKEVNVLNEKLTTAQSEINNKDTLVKQHAKVAEEAISGWEKAEAEASALKIQLETVTLNKLSSDERAAHLDSALKECMKQVRNVKEESEQKLHDVVFAKTKQWEKIKSEFESRISEFEQELLRANAENAALSRSLHERSNLIMKISEEKSQAEAEIEMLKNNIQSCEREISSLKYELHVVAKELEIRNEEKNMSVRSADVANRQHTEDVKKITKLEAECQRLRGLVRKKLPGPAALAQMKMEVESMGREYGEPRIRRPVTPAMENHLHQMQKENEFLTSRLFAMEEETKMLKEALSKKNTELQVTRNSCAKTASKLRSMEVQLLTGNQQKVVNGRTSNGSNVEVHFDGDSNPPSLTSMSEDGDDVSMSESWANALMSELSNFKKKENGRGSIGSINNNTVMTTQSEGSTHLELMDDFLEMERLACESTNNGTDSISESTSKMENGETKNSPSPSPPSPSCSTDPESPISKLRSRIVSLFDSEVPEGDIAKVIITIKNALKEVQVELQGSSGENGTPGTEEDLKTALSQIRDFVTSLGKEATEIHGRSSENCQTLSTKIEEFSVTVDKALDADNGLFDLIIALSGVLSETNNMNCSTIIIEGENNGLDCVDKVTLLENKVAPQEEPGPNIEELKLEKKNLEEELARCNEQLESTQLKFAEMEKSLGEVRTKLADSEKANGLMETQLKCMAESYKALETRKAELEGEIGSLKEKMETLNEELLKERESHEDDLVKYKELQEQLERNEKDSMAVDADEDIKAKQEKEIAAAAEKLAECQETILFLGRQLQSLRPPPESKHRQSTDNLSDDERDARASNFMHTPKTSMQLDGSESPMVDGFGSNMSMSETEKSPLNNSKRPKHRSPRSSSTSSLSGHSSERSHIRSGFTRFFSKGKGEN